MSSAMLLTGKDGWTTSKLGNVATKEMGAKSRKLYGKLGLVAGDTAWVVPVPIKIV